MTISLRDIILFILDNLSSGHSVLLRYVTPGFHFLQSVSIILLYSLGTMS
jgi:hypothetical protein